MKLLRHLRFPLLAALLTLLGAGASFASDNLSLDVPVGSRTPAPVCDKWPDTGYWLSTNSDKRHNRNCENYRKTRGYPCRRDEGSPCGKCGG